MPSSIPPRNTVAAHLPESIQVKSQDIGLGSGLRLALFGLISAAAGVSGAHATTISWGSLLRSDFRDSNGNRLTASFTVQLGFFESFTPSAANVSDWGSRWRVFDQATLNLGLNPDTSDHFASRAELSALGRSDSPFANNVFDSPSTNFQLQTAYIWIRNSTNPVPGTEWFLATAGPAWQFPLGVDECCDPALDLEFSASDLFDSNPAPETTTPVRPVWGSQSNTEPQTPVGARGDGVYAVTSLGYDLQTFTFPIPEPSTLLLTLAGSCLLLIRRRPTA